MKRLLLLSMVLCFFAGCGKEETTIGTRPDDPAARYEPHFYGAAMLENPAPVTRGVANQLKVWNNTFSKNITVKFLNGDPAYQDYVQKVAMEWQKAANVKFNFVDPTQKAIVRVAFNYNPTMMCSWALTGTDHLQVMNNQEEPTVNFSWRRAADAQKRSDVLRAFGQVLGLELEFRHPNCHPTWITDSEGNINEAEIRTYWESELGNYITWEELKKMVLDPLEDETFFIVSTPEYDSLSVMNWPFYRQLDEKLPFIRFDTDFNTELSEQDRQFIKELYGEPVKEPVVEPDPTYLDLVTFESSQNDITFSLTTTKKLRIQWDEEFTYINAPADASTHEERLNYTFKESKLHHVTISEEIAPGQEIPATSTALTKFAIYDTPLARNIDIKLINKGLEEVRVHGGETFTKQIFWFSDMPNLKYMYMVGLKNSQLMINNCPNLIMVSTASRVPAPYEITPLLDGNGQIIPIGGTPETPHSIIFLTITNCPNLTTLFLENTHVQTTDFSHFEQLDYIYLSSEKEYITSEEQDYLRKALQTLPNRKDKTEGKLFIRRIEISPDGVPEYVPFSISNFYLGQVVTITQRGNWNVIACDGINQHL